jgi:hypothetical protein
LVLAGSNIVKAIIEGNKILKKCNEDDIEMPDEVYDYLHYFPLNESYTSLVWAAGEMEFGVEHPHDFLRIKYADAVSLFVFNNTNAERYLELLYELLTTDTVPEELLAIEKQVSPDIIYWVRRNL